MADQAPEAGARAEQFRDHDADQPASDAELETGQDERDGRRQRDLEENLPREAPNERSISISRSLVVRSPASVLMATGKHTRKITTSTFDQMPIPSQRIKRAQARWSA